MPTPSEHVAAHLHPEAVQATDLALCRATVYAALALGFRPPVPETVERLTRPEAAAALGDAARMLDTLLSRPAAGAAGADDRTAADTGTGLAPLAIGLARPDAELETLARAYRRLFGHTVRSEVPPYETEYGDEAIFQQPQELGDLAGFMRAFGLTLRPEAHERIDHVSCECEFLSFLACKEAYAIEVGDGEMREATGRAATLFLRDHVGRFVPAFARRLVRADAGGFYGALAAVLQALVDADCRRLRVATGPQQLGLRPDPAACAAPMGCGADAPCPAGSGSA